MQQILPLQVLQKILYKKDNVAIILNIYFL